MFTYIASALSVNVMANTQAITSSGADLARVDVSGAEGPILITLIVPAGGSNTMSTAVYSHTADAASGSAIPAAALVSATTGAAATFADVSTAASVQTLAVNRELVKRYLYLHLTGTTLTQTVTVVVTFLKKYA